MLALTCAGIACAEPVAGDGRLDVLYPFHAERSGGPHDTENAVTTHVVFDAGRGCVVRCGGLGRVEGLPFTAEWDGTAWTGVDCPAVPPVQGGFRLAYDAARSNVVLFGSYPPSNETWLYDGTRWTNANPPHRPAARAGHDMVYDAARERIVLFGGFDGGTNAFGDTWEWDGADWTPIGGLTNAPAPRKGHQMVYDAAREVTLLLRGAWRGSAYNDTWEWDGQAWRDVTPGALPGGTGALVYDAAAARVRLFDLDQRTASDVWTCEDGVWSKKTYGRSPYSTGRDLAVDPVTGHAVYLKVPMRIQDQGQPPQTWIWNGGVWSNATPFTWYRSTDPTAWSDVDGDGRPDLVAGGQVWNPAAGEYKPGIALYRNRGGRLPPAPDWTIRTDNRLGHVLVEDVDADGTPDLVVGQMPGNLLIFGGTNAAFTAKTAWRSANSPYATELALADVDGDGFRDLVLLDAQTDDAIYVYRGGTNGFETSPGLSFAAPPASDGGKASVSGTYHAGNMAWADFDNDGAAEGALYWEYASTSVEAGPWVALLKATASNVTECARLPGLRGPLAFADVDGDWDADLLASGADPQATVWLRNTGGVLDPDPAWTAEPYGAYGGVAAVTAADFDGDGDLDIAKAWSDWGTTGYGHQLHRNQAGVLDTASSWKSQDLIGTDAQAGWDVNMVDFDGDGVLDVAAGVGIYLLTPTLRDTVPPSAPAYATARAATPGHGDVTLSWDPPPDGDIAFYRIYRGLTDLWGILVVEVPAPAGSVVLHTIPTGFDRFTVRAVDEAGNEGPAAEFEVIACLPDAVAASDGKPDASFAGRTLFGDTNGDGKPDVFTVRTHVGAAKTYTSWAVAANGGGAFAETWERRWGADPPGTPLTLGDVSGDGRDDLVVLTARVFAHGGVTQRWQVLDVYPAAGTGFSTSVLCTAILPGTGYLYGAAWGDANGDGYRDLAVAGAGPKGQAVVYHNLRGRLQEVPSWMSDIENVKAVAFGDLDNNKRDELAIGEDINGGTTTTSLRLYVYPGTAGGTSPTRSWADLNPAGGFNGTPMALSWADFNGDGKPDLTMFGEFAAYCYANRGGSLPTAPNPWGFLYTTLFVQSGALGSKPSHDLLGWAELDGVPPLDLYGKHSALLSAGSFTGLRDDAHLPPWTDLPPPAFVAQPWTSTGSLFLRVVAALDIDGNGIDDLVTDQANMMFLGARLAFPPAVGPAVTGLAVEPASPVVLTGAGARRTLTVMATFADASTRDVSGVADIEVSNPDDGQVVLRAEGNELIAVRDGSASVRVVWSSRSVNLTVYVTGVAPRPVGLALVPGTATLTRRGELLDLTAVATLDNGESVDVAARCSFSSDDPGVAGVADGTVTALATGTARIKATYEGLAATSIVQVALAQELTAVSIHPSDSAVAVGEYQGFEVRAHFEDGTVQPVTFQAVLGSDAPRVAAVSGPGVVGAGYGIAIVTARYLGLAAVARVVVTADVQPEDEPELIVLGAEPVGADQVAVDWLCAGPRHRFRPFTLYCSTNLSAGVWVPVASNLPPQASGFNAWTNSVSYGDARYFRVGMDGN